VSLLLKAVGIGGGDGNRLVRGLAIVPPAADGPGKARATAVTRSNGSRCLPKVGLVSAMGLRAS